VSRRRKPGDEGTSICGLNAAATLWCAAAVGVLAASGRLDPTVLGGATGAAEHLDEQGTDGGFIAVVAVTSSVTLRVVSSVPCGERSMRRLANRRITWMPMRPPAAGRYIGRADQLADHDSGIRAEHCALV
jgi:hypothetical protein